MKQATVMLISIQFFSNSAQELKKKKRQELKRGTRTYKKLFYEK